MYCWCVCGVWVVSVAVADVAGVICVAGVEIVGMYVVCVGGVAAAGLDVVVIGAECGGGESLCLCRPYLRQIGLEPWLILLVRALVIVGVVVGVGIVLLAAAAAVGVCL